MCSSPLVPFSHHVFVHVACIGSLFLFTVVTHAIASDFLNLGFLFWEMRLIISTSQNVVKEKRDRVV